MLRRRGNFAALRYRMLTRLLTPFVWCVLQFRRMKGKEHPKRWREKLGHASQQRPKGALVWIHGVGLGEALSARPIIASLRDLDPDLQFLVTSSTRASAEVLYRQLPPDVVHQFLPIDTPAACKRFLRHWRPDISIWVEQDVWPGLVLVCKAQNIPLALVNARMMDTAAEKRQRAQKLYNATYRAFDLISAQDHVSAKNLKTFVGYDIDVVPNLKSVAPPLQFDRVFCANWKGILSDRAVWVLGSAHLADVRVAVQAHVTLRRADPNATLVILPRYLNEIPEIETIVSAAGLTFAHTDAATADAVLIETTMGKSGLWYSVGAAALIGGGFDDTGGHSPWEAAHLECGILFGPNTKHFAPDYQTLDMARAAVMVSDANELSSSLMTTDFTVLARNATWAVQMERQKLNPIFNRLAALIRRNY